MAQEKFEERLNEVAEALEDILEDCNEELVEKGVSEAESLNDIAGQIGSISQGGGGASTWSEIENKPFETIGSGLSVDGQGVLSATGGGAGGADWNAASGEPGFIANKPFDIETTVNILSNIVIPYSPEYTEMFDVTIFLDEANPVEITQPLAPGDILSVSYNDKIIEEELVSYAGGVASKTFTLLIARAPQDGLILAPAEGSYYMVGVVDSQITAEAGDTLNITITKNSITKLSGTKINIDKTLEVKNNALAVNAINGYAQVGAGGIPVGGLATLGGLSISVGKGLAIVSDVAVLSYLMEPVYNAEASSAVGYTAYISEKQYSSEIGPAIIGKSISLSYEVNGETVTLSDTFICTGNREYATTNWDKIEQGAPIEEPCIGILLSPYANRLIVVDHRLPTDEGASIQLNMLDILQYYALVYGDISLAQAGYDGIGGIILGEGLELDYETQKTKVSASASTTLGGVKTYFDTNTGTLYVRTDGQDAEPSNP